MKAIKILSVLMILFLAGSRNIVDFSGSEIATIQESQTSMAGNNSSDSGLNPCPTFQEVKSVRPAGTYDRFDPYTLQGKTFTAGILVF